MKKTISSLFMTCIGLLFTIHLSFSQANRTDAAGFWRAELPTVAGMLPFHLSLEMENGKLQAYAINGKEKLGLDTPFFKNDSLHIPMEIFDAEIIAHLSGSSMKGIFNRKASNLSLRTVPFSAQKNQYHRFENEKKDVSNTNISGTWEVKFTTETGSYPSVGILEQTGSQVTGTFLTTTGDYRFLAGDIVGDSLKLSCFDGNHVFLFKAKINDAKLEGGVFCAAFSYTEKWEAVKNPAATLPDPTTLTYLKPGFETIDFAFKNTKNELVRLQDERYKGKVVLVQIMGSWCPNCMDESRFLAPYYQKNKDKGVEIIGLAYEKSTDPTFAYPKLDRMKERFGIEYEILLAGTNDKEVAARSLPMLSKILSFPTLLILDKKGKVREIHTGFSGPGTGKYYDKFVSDFYGLMEKLLAE